MSETIGKRLSGAVNPERAMRMAWQGLLLVDRVGRDLPDDPVSQSPSQLADSS